MSISQRTKNSHTMLSASRALVAAVLALGAATVHADDAPASKRLDKIDRVVVFADRAEVTRVSPATCKGGTASVTFANLPDAIDPRTLRGDADGPAVVVGVSTSSQALTEHLDAQVKKLQDEIQDLDDQLTRLARAQHDEDQRLQTVRSYGPWFRTLISEDLRQPSPEIARWEQLLTTIQTESLTSSKARVGRQAEARTLSRRRERLANRLGRLNPSTAPSSTVATVAVQCGSTSSPKVRLSYVVPGARWSPEYDLHYASAGRSKTAKTGKGEAVLTVAGVVTQSTGEDWNDAEIWLSTAKPRLGGEAPLPNPIYVYGAPEEEQKTLVQAQEVRAESLKESEATGSAVAGAALEDGGKAFVLKLPRRVTVHADGRPYWFPVDDVKASAVGSLVAVPSLSPWIFQVASLKNPAPYPLLAGTIHVFRGDTYVGDESLPYRAPGEEIELSLGIDEEITLERQDLVKRNREGGFFSGEQGIEQAWRVMLHNRSGGLVDVEIREQVPVSKSADVVVTMNKDKTTKGYTLDPLRGHLKWTVQLKSGGTATRDLAFAIALPKAWALQ